MIYISVFVNILWRVRETEFLWKKEANETPDGSKAMTNHAPADSTNEFQHNWSNFLTEESLFHV